VQLDTGFRPSRHGFGFPNRWRGPLLGLRSPGRCGGMVFAALDAFLAGRELSVEARSSAVPPPRSALAASIRGRQADSVLMRLAANLWQFVRYTWLPSVLGRGVAVKSRVELLALFDMLRSGRPAPLGLVNALRPLRLAANHQVLAYAADFGEQRTTISVYDPNHPKSDDVVLVVPISPAEPVVERSAKRTKRWRGFFIVHYSPKPPKPDALTPVP